MSQAMVAVFVRPNDSKVKGSVVKGSEPHNVIVVETESTHLNLHFDGMEQLDEFVRRISSAAQQVWDQLHPEEPQIPVGDGIGQS